MVARTRTRSGRISKAPERLELFEEVEDDFRDDEYDSDVDLLQSDDEDFCTDNDEEDSEYETDPDEDENGNLKGFVVDDTDEDEEYSEEEEEEEEEDE
tara:strand:- start:616 stop:909 length:294 start_codon:yes stop_codon:yes gene_type:complete